MVQPGGAEEDGRAEREQERESCGLVGAEAPFQEQPVEVHEEPGRDRRHEEHRGNRRGRAEPEIEPALLDAAEELDAHGFVRAVIRVGDSLLLELAQTVCLERVEDRIEHEQRNGRQRRDQHLVADDRVAIPVDEDVGVKALDSFDTEGAVFGQGERRVVLADDVGREVDRIDDPGDEEDAPPARGKSVHGAQRPRPGGPATRLSMA